jgi:gas vesicle protein
MLLRTLRKPEGAFIETRNQGDGLVESDIEEHVNGTGRTTSILIGLLIGGLAGAAAMLLLAPQSGKQTRAQIREKSIQPRDQTTASVKDALEQARVETDGLTAGVREKAGELKRQGKEGLVRQMDRASAALDAGKKAVKAA